MNKKEKIEIARKLDRIASHIFDLSMLYRTSLLTDKIKIIIEKKIMLIDKLWKQYKKEVDNAKTLL